MPHFITIIKYELIIVKYILALLHTIRRPRELGTRELVYSNEPILWLNLMKHSHFLKPSGSDGSPFKLYHGSG